MAYTEKHIETLTGLEPIRRNPTQYFDSSEEAGQLHAIKEILDNSLDEIALMGSSGRLDIILCQDVARSTYQIVIRDNGRGIPIGNANGDKLKACYTEMNTSGKYNADAYAVSAGLFGVGGKASAGASHIFRAISRRPDRTGSIRIHTGHSDPKATITDKSRTDTGMVVLFEPDPEIFTQIDTFLNNGYMLLTTLLKKYTFFRPYNIRFYIHNKPIAKNLWEADSETVIQDVERRIQTGILTFGPETYDRDAWIKSYFRVTRPWAWTYAIPYRNEKDRSLEFDIYLYYAKFEQHPAAFGMVNNVPIDNLNANHISVVRSVLSQHLAAYVKDPHIRRFVQETYKLPIHMAIDVKYSGAKFVGTTKHNFISADFRTKYKQLLMEWAQTSEGKGVIADLYRQLEDDIATRYAESLTGKSKAKNTDRLFRNLKYPNAFKNCSTSNRHLAELFIVEGQSAGSLVGRDHETQGQYVLRGKPPNFLSSNLSARHMAMKIQNHDIYKDLLTIIGIDIQKQNLDSLHFSHIYIMADADDHGKHISAILIGNLYAVCPQLIEENRVHIVNPPLYRIQYGKHSGFYLSQAEDKIIWMAKNLYQPTLDIFVENKAIYKKPYRLTGDEYVSCIVQLLNIGDTIDNLAAELSVPPYVIELLSYVTPYLTRGYMDIERVRTLLGMPRARYDAHNHVLSLSIGDTDYTVPLDHVNDRIYEQLLPKLTRIQWTQYHFAVKSKRTNAMPYTPIAITDLYSLLRSFDRLFNITRYKGLGSMEDAHRSLACMDRRYRTTYLVSGVGDPNVLYNLLGGDSRARKSILTKTHS